MSAHDDAKQALFSAITTTTQQVMDATGNPAQRANALQALALAFRYAAGGTQPGSSVVQS